MSSEEEEDHRVDTYAFIFAGETELFVELSLKDPAIASSTKGRRKVHTKLTVQAKQA